jgi:hypothetical protein
VPRVAAERVGRLQPAVASALACAMKGKKPVSVQIFRNGIPGIRTQSPNFCRTESERGFMPFCGNRQGTNGHRGKMRSTLLRNDLRVPPAPDPWLVIFGKVAWAFVFAREFE